MSRTYEVYTSIIYFKRLESTALSWAKARAPVKQTERRWARWPSSEAPCHTGRAPAGEKCAPRDKGENKPLRSPPARWPGKQGGSRDARPEAPPNCELGARAAPARNLCHCSVACGHGDPTVPSWVGFRNEARLLPGLPLEMAGRRLPLLHREPERAQGGGGAGPVNTGAPNCRVIPKSWGAPRRVDVRTAVVPKLDWHQDPRKGLRKPSERGSLPALLIRGVQGGPGELRFHRSPGQAEAAGLGARP